MFTKAKTLSAKLRKKEREDLERRGFLVQKNLNILLNFVL